MTTKMMNFTQFFKTEQELYVQNISNGQVSLQFGSGDEAVAFKLARRRDPIVLTNHVPFSLVAKSMDFRKLCTKGRIKLLTEAEYLAHFEGKAKKNRISLDAAIEHAESEHTLARSIPMTPATTAVTSTSDSEEEGEQQPSDESAVHPRVIHLCHQLSTQIPASDRMKPTDVLQQLKDLAEEFTPLEYEYILGASANQTIKKWATSQQAALHAAEEKKTGGKKAS